MYIQAVSYTHLDVYKRQVLAWAKNEVKLETEKYKKDQQTKAVQITFHSDHKLDYGQQVLYLSLIHIFQDTPRIF